MNQLQVFKNDLFEVAAKIEDDQILFDVEQVALSLGISTIVGGSKYVRWNRVNHYLPSNLPQVAKGDFIPESLVYKLAFKASNEVAERFQDWLAVDVIPEIRKHGMYATPQTIENILNDPDFGIKLLTTIKEERTLREEAELQRDKVVEQRQSELPYTNFGKIVSNSAGAISIGAFAKMMFDKHGLKIGRNKMFEWLRINGFLIRQGREYNNPKQIYIEQGLFEVKPSIVSRTDGDIEKLTTMITGKGQVVIANKLLNDKASVKIG